MALIASAGQARAADGFTEVAADSVSTAALAVLDLGQGGTLPGTLLEVPALADGPRKTLLWQSPAFAGPFEFAINSLFGIRFPRPAGESAPPRVGEWWIELADGDQFAGRVESIDERQVVISIGTAEDPTRIVVGRADVKSLFPRALAVGSSWGGGLIGLNIAPEGAWQESAAGLVSTVWGATLSRSVAAGPRWRTDLTLSWSQPPRLQISLGNGDGGNYRLEFAPDQMVAIRDEKEPEDGEGVGRADLQLCGKPPDESLSVSLFVDSQTGRLAVMRRGDDTPLADLTLSPRGEQTGGNFQLKVISGTATLESLRVSPWRGDFSAAGEQGMGSIRLADGLSQAVGVEGFDGDRNSLLVRDAPGTGQAPLRRLDVGEIAEIHFPTVAVANVAESIESLPRLQAFDIWGSQFTGVCHRVDADAVWLVHRSIEGPVRLPLAILTTLCVLSCKEKGFEPPPLPGRVGLLSSGEAKLWGCLESGGEAGAVAIGWHPRGSLNFRPLAMPADGSQPQATIHYTQQAAPGEIAVDHLGGLGVMIAQSDEGMCISDIPAESPAAGIGIVLPAVIRAVAPKGDGRFVETTGLDNEDVGHLLRGKVGSSVQIRVQTIGQQARQEFTILRRRIDTFGVLEHSLEETLQAHNRLLDDLPAVEESGVATSFGSLLILRTGETVPCNVTSIDAQGIQIQVAGGGDVTVPDGLVQALELVPLPGRSLTPEKFRSLTMLPRSQRHQPPTHLIRSQRGDYLRGRLGGLDGASVRIAVEASPRGKPLIIPRADVVRLIWLHPENLETAWEPPPAAEGEGLPVESCIGEGRMRLRATGVEGNLLLGMSPAIGRAVIDLGSVDRLLLGAGTSAPSPARPYAQWRLEPAPEPRNLPPRNPPSPAAN